MGAHGAHWAPICNFGWLHWGARGPMAPQKKKNKHEVWGERKDLKNQIFVDLGPFLNSLDRFFKFFISVEILVYVLMKFSRI